MKNLVLVVKISTIVVIDIVYVCITAFGLMTANATLFLMTLPGSLVAAAMAGVHGGEFSKQIAVLSGCLVNDAIATVFLIVILFVFPRLIRRHKE